MLHQFFKSITFFIVLISLSWSPGFAQCPPAGNINSNGSYTLGNGDDCTVAGSITVASNRKIDITMNSDSRLVVQGSYTDGNGGQIVLNTSDTFKIEGNMTLSTNDDLQINSGVLWVTGDLSISGNALFGAGGNVIIGGDFTVTGASADVTVDGGFSVAGDAVIGSNDLDIGDNAVFVADSLATTGNVDVGEGGTIYVADGLDGVSGTITNDPANSDQDCTNNCCGQLCNVQGTSLSGDGDEVLPITLSSFSGNSEGSAVNLGWITATEINFEKFELYKFVNGQKKLIGIIGSTGKSDGDSYSFSDLSPHLGLNIYQLKSIDYDGYSEWFPAISVDFRPNDLKFEVYPNPSVAQALRTDIYEPFHLSIYSISGNEIFASRQSHGDDLSIPPLAPGIYLFRFDVNGTIETQRVIIDR